MSEVSNALPDDIAITAHEIWTMIGHQTEITPFRRIAEALVAERERAAQICMDWRATLDNRSAQAEGWAAATLAELIMKGSAYRLIPNADAIDKDAAKSAETQNGPGGI